MADLRDELDKARNILTTAKDLNELVFMAAEALGAREAKNAITAGCNVIDEHLKKVCDILDDVQRVTRETAAVTS